jgi:hypothetical protein
VQILLRACGIQGKNPARTNSPVETCSGRLKSSRYTRCSTNQLAEFVIFSAAAQGCTHAGWWPNDSPQTGQIFTEPSPPRGISSVRNFRSWRLFQLDMCQSFTSRMDRCPASGDRAARLGRLLS